MNTTKLSPLELQDIICQHFKIGKDNLIKCRFETEMDYSMPDFPCGIEVFSGVTIEYGKDN